MRNERGASRQLNGNAKRLLIVVNVDWSFLSHRLPIALAAKDAGYDVTVAAADTGRADDIRRHGLTFVPLPLQRTGTSAFREVLVVFALARLYRSMRPAIIHHVTIKPVLYGSLIARLVPHAKVVNAVSGLGYAVETGPEWGRRLVLTAYRALFRRSGTRVILQNPDHVALFERERIIRSEHIVLIEGSGVDPDRFTPPVADPEPPVVMLPGRMLVDKGVREFVEAARQLRQEGSVARFVLVGAAGDDNPTAIDAREIARWVEDGTVEWWGHRTDMPAVLRQATVVTLPSYHEGLPLALLEAAAAGRAIVASDVPGCRSVVHAGVNGVLVPARDAGALAEAIARLLLASSLRSRMGEAGRKLVLERFSVDRVVESTLTLYEELLGEAR